ncbi:hypothetical protein GCM10009742_68770 [Kribbella karoonensis]|uniref:Uncharacterized protein n=1 Tax=Kribbella karoonensis TaxID=324851 RepID=A0ABN2EKF9_9ACTN
MLLPLRMLLRLGLLLGLCLWLLPPLALRRLTCALLRLPLSRRLL